MQNLYHEIAEKRKILREIYGGQMTKDQLKREINCKSDTTLKKRVEALKIPASQNGQSITYDTDVVAKRLVEIRGMV